MIQIEHRAAVELRAVGRHLVGHAAVFDQPARIGGRFTETIRRGAFRDSLGRGADILALVDHDPTRLLGRTKSGTLELHEDDRGLAFRIALADTQLARDVLVMAERQDIGGASIGFRVSNESWPASDRREVRGADLVEISIVVSHPAYDGTDVQARAAVHLGDLDLIERVRRRLARL